MEWIRRVPYPLRIAVLFTLVAVAARGIGLGTWSEELRTAAFVWTLFMLRWFYDRRHRPPMVHPPAAASRPRQKSRRA